MIVGGAASWWNLSQQMVRIDESVKGQSAFQKQRDADQDRQIQHNSAQVDRLRDMTIARKPGFPSPGDIE